MPPHRISRLLKLLRYEWLAPLLWLGLFLWVSRSPYYLDVEYRSQKYRYTFREDAPVHPDLLIIDIDDRSIDDLGRWPWPRHIYGTFLQLLTLHSPSVIVFDIIFPDSSRDSKEDLLFVEGIQLHSKILTGAYSRKPKREDSGDEYQNPNKNPPWEIEDSIDEPLTWITGDVEQIEGNPTALYPIAELQRVSHFGFVDMDPSPIDGIRRYCPIIVRVGKRVYPSLALKAVMLHWGIDPDRVEIVLGEHVILHRENGDRRIPIDEGGRMRINYHREGVFANLGFSLGQAELASEYLNDTPWPARFPDPENKIVIIGQKGASMTDLGPTPYEGRTPLVRIQANVIDNILKGDYIQEAPDWLVALSTLLLGWATLFYFKHRSFLWTLGVPACLLLLYIVVTFWAFSFASVELPFLWPLASFTCMHLGANYLRWRHDAQQKRRIQGMFGTYLSPELVQRMVDSGEEPMLGGEDAEVTAFFSDVQDFTTLSEQLSPKQLVTFMNDYLTALTRVLKAHGCYVDKYIGDAIVGIFNAPIPIESHALKACIASCRIQQRLLSLREKWRSEGDLWPLTVHHLQTRIGLNTGRATVGNMGSEDRFNYTMMGDDVNLASRCEGVAKTYGVYIMVTGETRAAAEAQGDHCIFRYLDKIRVKGRQQAVEVHELVCLREHLTEEIEYCLRLYRAAMRHYTERRWQEAHAAFIEASHCEPNRKELNPASPTTPSEVMARRSLYMEAHPPASDWDGVYTMTTK